MLRAAPGSTGDGLRLGLEAGAATSAGLDEFYGRAMPAPPAASEPGDFVELAQLYAAHAVVESATGERYEPRTWSEIDVVQWVARQPRRAGDVPAPELDAGDDVCASERSARWSWPRSAPARTSSA